MPQPPSRRLVTEDRVDTLVAEAVPFTKATAPRFIDAYADYFYGTHTWVAGQATAATTLTAAVLAGVTVLPVASSAGLVAGVALVTGQGSAAAQQFKVVSVAGNDVTVAPAVTTALASGAPVTPWWSDAIHPTTAGGGPAFGYWLAHRPEFDQAGKVTVLGNSWVGYFFAEFKAEIEARLPGTTTVNAGVAGNRAVEMLARFDTDVPADSDYVLINEPGVNDAAGTALDTQIAQVAQLVAKIRALGAIPVVVGPVPLANNPVESRLQAQVMREQFANPATYPAATLDQVRRSTAPAIRPEVGSIGVGDRALMSATTGTANTGTGYRALSAVTSGSQNTAYGYQALSSNTSGASNVALGNNTLLVSTASSNTAVGARALTASTTGGTNTGVGANSLAAVTTGTGNVGVGYNALTASTANANTAVGNQALQANTVGGQNTAVGNQALQANVDATGSTAVGYTALLASTGAANTAVGGSAFQSVTTGANNVAVGKNAGQAPAGTAGNATTTGSGHTFVGYQTGLTSATQAANVTAVGFQSRAGGHYATALGAGTTASHLGAVAIGTDNGGGAATSNANNDFVLGTVNHRYRMPGLPTVAPAAASGILWNDGGVVKVA